MILMGHTVAMNIALIIAGGVGMRMCQPIPKQFMEVNGIPIIMYTLRTFQDHPEIDKIEVVCLDGWQDWVKKHAEEGGITKISGIDQGGETGQASTRNGVMSLREKFSPEDIVIIHSANRPMVTAEIISDCIATCKKFGSAVTAIPCIDAMVYDQPLKVVPRERLIRTQAPQAFRLSELVSAHEEALQKGITGSVDSCTLMIELGRNVVFSKGSEKNIKITISDDVDIFKALLAIDSSP